MESYARLIVPLTTPSRTILLLERRLHPTAVTEAEVSVRRVSEAASASEAFFVCC